MPEVQRNVFSFAFFLIGKLGYEAVIVFFVLSGFLVGGKGLERIRNHSFDVSSYAIDRTVRIGIPLVTAIALGIVVKNITGMECDYLSAFGNLLSLQGILCEPFVSPFWSLSYEVWFYVFLAAIGMMMQRQRKGMWLFIICCLAFLRLAPYFLLLWFMGAFSYYLRPSKKSKPTLRVSLAMALLFACLSVGGGRKQGHSSSVQYRPKSRRCFLSLLPLPVHPTSSALRTQKQVGHQD